MMRSHPPPWFLLVGAVCGLVGGVIQHTGKTDYRIGGLAINGKEALERQMGRTFRDYMTREVGPLFNPPLTFDMISLDFVTTYSLVESAEIDFVYTNPSIYSCIEWQYGSSSLATLRRKRQGQELNSFGGIIFVRADNTEVRSISDIKDKIVAAASISGLGSGQAQWLMMQQKSMSLMQDPKQVVFTSNQGEVVKGVYSGTFDVGFVRTDQIEGMESRATPLKGEDGTTVPCKKSLFRYVDVVERIVDGSPFPFDITTVLYPEWNLAALPHVGYHVSREVQKALMKIESWSDEATNGSYIAWQPSLSYLPLIDMNQRLGTIVPQEGGGAKTVCQRAATLYDAIVCPPGHFKMTEEEVNEGCVSQNLTCPEGDRCLCRPCRRADEVEIIPEGGGG